MSEIKSQKAKEYIDRAFLSENNELGRCYRLYGEIGIGVERERIDRCKKRSYYAVVIAETEAEQRLQQLAYELHKATCVNIKCEKNTAKMNGFGNNNCNGNCIYLTHFLLNLNIK